MNFCVAILILKMEETTHFWCVMLYYFKKHKNTTETQKKDLCNVWEGAVTNGICQEWFAKFLGTIDILLQAYLKHWKMFSNTPGLYPLEANSGRQPYVSLTHKVCPEKVQPLLIQREPFVQQRHNLADKESGLGCACMNNDDFTVLVSGGGRHHWVSMCTM